MITLPPWFYIISVIIVFPILHLGMIKFFKIKIRSEISILLALQLLSLAIVLELTIIALYVFDGDLSFSLIGYPVAIIFFIIMSYLFIKKIKVYRDTIKDMTTNINCSMQEMTASSEQITMTTQSISTKALDINQSSEKIRTLMTILTDISEKINFLALNATIEAGRLDEAKGFMAVARELQKLYEQTKNQIIKSKKEVKIILDEIKGFSIHTEEITSATEEQTSSMEEIMDQILKLTKEIER